jgi:hypothetical protein
MEKWKDGDTSTQKTMETTTSVGETSVRGKTGGKEMAGKNSSLVTVEEGGGGFLRDEHHPWPAHLQTN